RRPNHNHRFGRDADRPGELRHDECARPGQHRGSGAVRENYLEPQVELKHVSFGYGADQVLEDISLHLHPGQFAALVGPSGAGKTSLLKLILGTLEPTQGQIFIGGHSNRWQAPLQIGYVPQLEAVDWNFPVTVGEAVLMGRARRSGIW